MLVEENLEELLEKIITKNEKGQEVAMDETIIKTLQSILGVCKTHLEKGYGPNIQLLSFCPICCKRKTKIIINEKIIVFTCPDCPLILYFKDNILYSYKLTFNATGKTPQNTLLIQIEYEKNIIGQTPAQAN